MTLAALVPMNVVMKPGRLTWFRMSHCLLDSSGLLGQDRNPERPRGIIHTLGWGDSFSPRSYAVDPSS